jgi:hypothetical protein
MAPHAQEKSTSDWSKEFSTTTTNTSYTGAAKKKASGLYSFAISLVDRVVAKDTRQHAYNGIYNFSVEQPVLAVSSISLPAHRVPHISISILADAKSSLS